MTRFHEVPLPNPLDYVEYLVHDDKVGVYYLNSSNIRYVKHRCILWMLEVNRKNQMIFT